MSQGVQFNRLMLEMRAMQTDAMARSKPEVQTQEVGAPSFSDMLGQAVNKVHETQQVSSQLASAFEMGQGGVDLTEQSLAHARQMVTSAQP